MPDFDPSKIVIVLIFLAILVAIKLWLSAPNSQNSSPISQIIQQLKSLIL